MNEAIKKILPGLNLDEDCTSYKIPDHRFFHDFPSEEDTEEVEYHPLQFGLSSEQRTTTQPEILKSFTTTSSKKDSTSQSTIGSTVATHRSTAGFSASKIPIAFLQTSPSSTDAFGSPKTSQISLSTTNTPLKLSTSSQLPIELSTTSFITTSASIEDKIEDTVPDEKAIIEDTASKATETIENDDSAEDEEQNTANATIVKTSDEPLIRVEISTDLPVTIDPAEQDTTSIEPIPEQSNTNSTLPSSGVLSSAPNKNNVSENGLEIKVDHQKVKITVANNTDIIGASDTNQSNNETLRQDLDDKLAIDNIDPKIFEAITTNESENKIPDSSDVTLIKLINVNNEVFPVIAENIKVEEEKIQDRKVRNSTESYRITSDDKETTFVTEDSVIKDTSENVIIIGASPNIAQPISSYNVVRSSKTINAGNDLSSQSINLSFSILILQVSLYWMS